MNRGIKEFPVSSLTIIFFITGTCAWILGIAMQFDPTHPGANILFSIFWMLVGVGMMLISTQLFYIMRVLRRLRRKVRVRKKRKKALGGNKQ